MACGGQVEVHRILGWTSPLRRRSKARTGVARRLHLDDARQHLPHRRGKCAGPGHRLCPRFAENPQCRVLAELAPGKSGVAEVVISCASANGRKGSKDETALR